MLQPIFDIWQSHAVRIKDIRKNRKFVDISGNVMVRKPTEDEHRSLAGAMFLECRSGYGAAGKDTNYAACALGIPLEVK